MPKPKDAEPRNVDVSSKFTKTLNDLVLAIAKDDHRRRSEVIYYLTLKGALAFQTDRVLFTEDNEMPRLVKLSESLAKKPRK